MHCIKQIDKSCHYKELDYNAFDILHSCVKYSVTIAEQLCGSS